MTIIFLLSIIPFGFQYRTVASQDYFKGGCELGPVIILVPPAKIIFEYISDQENNNYDRLLCSPIIFGLIFLV